MENTLQTKEIEIPVPWGHVAGKAWGDDKDKIVLTFHGLYDNAGSFDKLIPLLPKSFYYVCIDLPGHGKSSHFPSHLPIHSMDYIMVYRLITSHFNKDRYIFMAHSYGGQLALLFSILYPQAVEKLIMLDAIAPFPVESGDAKKYLVGKFDHFLAIERKLISNKQPTYTYEEAFKKIQLNRNYGGDLTAPAATGIVQRMIEPVGNGRYRFTLDQRLKCLIGPLTDTRYLIEAFTKSPATCPILMILCSESSSLQEYLKPILKVLMNWKNVFVKIVNGNHGVHSDYPENVAPLVTMFLLNEISKL